MPETAALLEEIAAALGTPQFEKVFAELYPQCENISVDFAILEPQSAKGEGASNIYCFPADFGWKTVDVGGAFAHLADRGSSTATSTLTFSQCG